MGRSGIGEQKKTERGQCRTPLFDSAAAGYLLAVGRVVLEPST